MTNSAFIVIVNYRTARLVVDCLESLVGERSALRGGRVVVVDNLSSDGSVEQIGEAIRSRRWSDWVKILPMPRNGGFAYGNNAGIAHARQLDPAYAAVILLNPDTVVAPGAIGALLHHLAVEPSCGIAGAAIVNAEGQREGSAHRWPSPLGELEGSAQFQALSAVLRRYAVSPPIRSTVHRCDWVSGACMAIRREVVDAIGPLDEGYFLYFEEVDFCRRAHLQGWHCSFVPDAQVMHLEGAATDIRAGRRRRPSYWYASRRRFFVKAYGVIGLLTADLLWLLGRSTLVLRRALNLGGHAGAASEPSRYTADMIGGDVSAMLRGDLRGLARMSHGMRAGG